METPCILHSQIACIDYLQVEQHDFPFKSRTRKTVVMQDLYSNKAHIIRYHNQLYIVNAQVMFRLSNRYEFRKKAKTKDPVLIVL
jgi:hypothetical protein